jgi:hypothetical protein
MKDAPRQGCRQQQQQQQECPCLKLPALQQRLVWTGAKVPQATPVCGGGDSSSSSQAAASRVYLQQQGGLCSWGLRQQQWQQRLHRVVQRGVADAAGPLLLPLLLLLLVWRMGGTWAGRRMIHMSTLIVM